MQPNWEQDGVVNVVPSLCSPQYSSRLSLDLCARGRSNVVAWSLHALHMDSSFIAMAAGKHRV